MENRVENINTNSKLPEDRSETGSVEIVNSDLGELSHELTYHKYLLNNDHIRSFLRKLSVPEYLALRIIKDIEQEGDITGRTYLKDIAEKMHRTIRQTSAMVKALQERGFLTWSHDGDGSEGTYVTITKAGREMLAQEESAIKNYYGRVIENFGKDNLLQLLQLMKQLEESVSEEFIKTGVAEIESGSDDE